jgi:hypothetical protein
MDSEFTDSAIREYLIEKTRPVPASPGVDAAAVLGEAVAARTRTKLRDTGLVLLFLGAVLLAPAVLLGVWPVVACMVRAPAAAFTIARKLRLRKPAAYVVTGMAMVGALLYLVVSLLGIVGGDELSFDSPYTPSESISDWASIGAVVLVAEMLAVLVADRFVVWYHLNKRFWPNGVTRIAPWLRDRPLLRFGSYRQVKQLNRYADPRTTMAEHDQAEGAPVPLMVYRDFVPFVGAGVPKDPWSIAVPLEELPDAEPTTELTTTSLYAGIHAEITSLRAARGLAPGRRLDDLGIDEVVIVSADELVDHLAEPSAADFLAEPGTAPFTMLRRERVEAIKADPLEWARYYQRYQLETWDRDLVVTVFVHVAVGQGALYVEWTPCVLRPIRKEYREIDMMPRSSLRPIGRAVLDLAAFPLTLPRRLVRAFSFLRPLPKYRGMIVPDVYGAAASLRELAADDEVHNYFQLADVERYLKMLESRLVLAVGRMMRAAGYSPASFDKKAASVVNNNIQIDGSIAGNVLVGSNNKVGNAAAAPRQ